MSDPIIAPGVAQAAMAPLKGPIDAVLGPTLERIRRWSADRELKRQTSAEVLEVVFRKYLERALPIFSHIQSIAFPLRNIPLATIYEPLNLDWLWETNGRPDIRRDILNSGKHTILIDKAGMGKTTFSKYICLCVCAETEMIPVVVNLRLYDGSRPLLDMYRHEISELDSEFPLPVFLSLVLAGRFFFVADGFDEVQPQLQSKLRVDIEQIANKIGKSTIFITSRPQRNLPVLPRSVQCEFASLEREQVESLALKYDSYSSLDVGKRLIDELDHVPQKLLETPLMVAILYRTFGFNSSIANRISVFYSETYEALYKGHDLTKSGFSREKLSKLDVVDFRRLLAAFCFLVYIGEKSSFTSDVDGVNVVERALRLVPVKLEAPKYFWDDLQTAVPFLVSEGLEIKFIHRTFLEFFAAEFIARADRAEALLSRLLQKRPVTGLNQVIEFLADTNATLARKIIFKPIAEQLLKIFPNKPVDAGIMAHEFYHIRIKMRNRESHETEVGLISSMHIRTDGTIELDHFHSGSDVVSITGTPKKSLKGIPACAWLEVSTASTERLTGFSIFSSWPEIDLFIQGINNTTKPLTKTQINSMMSKPWGRYILQELVHINIGGRGKSLNPRSGTKLRLVDLTKCRDLLTSIESEAKENLKVEDLLK